MIELTGAGEPLSPIGFEAARKEVDVTPEALWAVLAVETSGCGFLADRRPKILFERHVFHRLTGGTFDVTAAHVSAPSAGGYGPGGAHQHERLLDALRLDEEAALRSASWGLGQIMGENHEAAGFADPAGMVAAFVGSEDAQLLGMARFIVASGMGPLLRAHDWAGFARRYNGPAYAKNSYDSRLRTNCERYRAAGPPDLVVRAAQVYLTYRGFDPGTPDGVTGGRTVSAVKAFQRAEGLEPTGTIDNVLIERLAQ
jgi:hypothetical protein